MRGCTEDGTSTGWKERILCVAIGRQGHERRRARMDGAKWARYKQYAYDCRIARGASKDPTTTEEQRERMHEAYERHHAGEMTREEFEAWCSGFWAGKGQ